MRFPTSRSDSNQMRLDASETIWFVNQLKFIDKEQYQIVFPENQARSILPTQGNIPDWAASYEWREYEQIGKAKIITGSSDDLPRVDVVGRPNLKAIKDIGASYGYTIKEIKRAVATGVNLDSMRAAAARMAIETEVDRILALGDATHNLEGLLAFSGITPVVATTKTGGGTNWTAAALADEIANDVFKLINSTIAACKQAGGRVFRRFRIVMPDPNYTLIAQRRVGNNLQTILQYLLQSPFIESIVPWWRCSQAAANGTDDRMACFPPDPMVVAGIVPQEYTPQDPEKRNLEYVINTTGSTGGAVARYKFAVGYMDAIQVA